jgi:hypothetical protein
MPDVNRRTAVLSIAAVVIVGLAALVAHWLWHSVDPTDSAAEASATERETSREIAAADAAAVRVNDAGDATRTTADEFDPVHFVKVETCELWVKAVDETDHHPLEGVELGLNRFDIAGLPPFPKATTAGDGIVALQIPTGRRLRIAATAPDYSPTVFTVRKDTETTREAPVEIALGRAASLDGTLLDAADRPVVGAVVTSRFAYVVQFETDQDARAWALNMPRNGDSTSSDAAGKFHFDSLPADFKLLLHVDNLPGVERSAESLVLWLEPGEHRELVWRVHSPPSIQGQVVDGGGRVVAGAVVNAFQQRSSGSSIGGSANAQTGTNGEFEVRGLSPGTCVLEVESLDRRYEAATFACELEAGECRSGVVLTLPSAAPLIIRPRLDAGRRPTRAAATTRSRANGRAVSLQVAFDPSDDAGATITFRAVPLGDVDVELLVTADDRMTSSASTTFHHDGEHECVLDCALPAQVYGSFVATRGAGRAVLVPCDSTVLPVILMTGIDATAGTFEFERVAAGRYDLILTLMDGFVAVVPSLSISAGERREIPVTDFERTATLVVTGPSIQDRFARSFPKLGSFQVRVIRGRDRVGVSLLSPSSRVEIPVPPGRLTVELSLSGVVVDTRECAVKAGEVVRVHFDR